MALAVLSSVQIVFPVLGKRSKISFGSFLGRYCGSTVLSLVQLVVVVLRNRFKIYCGGFWALLSCGCDNPFFGAAHVVE